MEESNERPTGRSKDTRAGLRFQAICRRVASTTFARDTGWNPNSWEADGSSVLMCWRFGEYHIIFVQKNRKDKMWFVSIRTGWFFSRNDRRLWGGLLATKSGAERCRAQTGSKRWMDCLRLARAATRPHLGSVASANFTQTLTHLTGHPSNKQGGFFLSNQNYLLLNRTIMMRHLIFLTKKYFAILSLMSG